MPRFYPALALVLTLLVAMAAPGRELRVWLDGQPRTLEVMEDWAFVRTASDNPVAPDAVQRSLGAESELLASYPSGLLIRATTTGETARIARDVSRRLAGETQASARGQPVLVSAADQSAPRGNASRRETRDPYALERLRMFTDAILIRPAQEAAARAAGATSVTPTIAPDLVRATFADPWAALDAAIALSGQGHYVEPLVERQRFRRSVPNDPLFGNQWHLNDTVGADHDINVLPVWTAGTFGNNVTAVVVDDGLETGHPDMIANTPAVGGILSTSFHWDFNDNDNDPNPGASDAHGTACAGLIGAVRNNNLGVSGVAPDAQLLGIRLISGPASDANEANAMLWRNDIADVSSNSWGPSDDAATLAAPGSLTLQSLIDGTVSGRNGNGIIYVWAAGNGGNPSAPTADDDSNYDGYANNIRTIAISALGDNGQPAGYSESGANIVAAAPSNGGTNGITTTDVTGSAGYDATDYTPGFGGTSAACPIAAGVVALMLEANPNLTWIDVQHILITTSRTVDGLSGFVTNGAGHDFHPILGAGLIDADAAVTAAVNAPYLCTSPQVGALNQFPNEGIGQANPQRVYTFPVTESNPLLWVQLRVDITHPYRGDLQLEIESPSGMISTIPARSADAGDNFTDWYFMSVRHWGENPAGTWTVTITDVFPSVDDGTVDFLALRLWTCDALPPAAPTGLAYDFLPNGDVRLIWVDNSLDEDSFRIERALGAGSFSEIAQVGANTTTWDDSTAVGGNTYRYRVRAARNDP